MFTDLNMLKFVINQEVFDTGYFDAGWEPRLCFGTVSIMQTQMALQNY